MKVILVALGVLFSLQVFAQNTVSYTYDSAGNRVARTAPRSNVASTDTKTLHNAAEQTPSVFLVRNLNGEESPAGASLDTKRDIASVSSFPFWDKQNLLITPGRADLSMEAILPPVTATKKNYVEKID